MKYFVIIICFFFNAFIYAQTLYYKNVNSEEKSDTMQVKFPEDCLKIVEIYNDSSLEFKNNETIEEIVSDCNTFLKGKKVKETLKSGTDKILDTGIKVKEGIQKGFKSGTNSVSEETNLFIDDAVKIKDGVVGGTSKIINGTVEAGSKITSGVSSFFKGIFSSDN